MAKGKGFFGWIIGLLTGTLLGVLFAPRKGKEVRSRIKSSRHKGAIGHRPLLEDLKKMGEEIAETAKELYESPDVQDVVRRGRRKMRELGGELFDEFDDFQESTLVPAVNSVQKKVKEAKGKVRRARGRAKKAAAKAKKAAAKAKKATHDMKEVASDLKRSIEEE